MQSIISSIKIKTKLALDSNYQDYTENAIFRFDKKSLGLDKHFRDKHKKGLNSRKKAAKDAYYHMLEYRYFVGSMRQRPG